MVQVDLEQFALNFRTILKKENIKQSQLSRMSGISPMAISNWATGKALPCTEHLVLMAKKLNVTVEDLMKNVVKE